MKIGIFGGSGLYEMEGIRDLQEHRVATPFGDPSDLFVSGTLQGRGVVFLPRHGRGHRILPTDIPYRANVWAMKKLGVTHLISVSAVGSLQENIEPGHLVFPDQFIDRTFHRESTFFGDGVVGHVQFGFPVCQHMIDVLAETAGKLGIHSHAGGTYVCVEGPAFSTRAESLMYRTWGGAVIGMTNLQEAKLAREAELCFCTIALATDYDCWHEEQAEVSVEAVLKVMQDNVVNSKRLLAGAVAALPERRECAARDALRYAILTSPDKIPEAARRNLEPIIGRYLGAKT